MSSVRNCCAIYPCRELECGVEVALLVCLDGYLVDYHSNRDQPETAAWTACLRKRLSVFVPRDSAACVLFFHFPLVAICCTSHRPPRPRGLMECKTGAFRTLGVTASLVRDDSSMLVTGAPIGSGDPSRALSNAHVVMQCNAIVY